MTGFQKACWKLKLKDMLRSLTPVYAPRGAATMQLVAHDLVLCLWGTWGMLPGGGEVWGETQVLSSRQAERAWGFPHILSPEWVGRGKGKALSYHAGLVCCWTRLQELSMGLDLGCEEGKGPKPPLFSWLQGLWIHQGEAWGNVWKGGPLRL